jgi:hypothetical protein
MIIWSYFGREESGMWELDLESAFLGCIETATTAGWLVDCFTCGAGAPR